MGYGYSYEHFCDMVDIFTILNHVFGHAHHPLKICLFAKIDHFIGYFFQIFHFRVDQENRLSNLFSTDLLPQMFANIKSIYKFHAEFFLPQVKYN